MEFALVGLFAIAAVGGLTLAGMKFAGKELPIPLALLHGAFAAAGLVTLILNVMKNGTNRLLDVSLGLFVIAALGGFVLFSLQLMKKAQPALLIAVHGLVAVIAFAVLLFALFG